jgi:c-di-GMP-binding flagellar brake protein YcgR
LHTAMLIERRQHPRVKLAASVLVKTHRKCITGTTKDISVGGAFIRCQRPLESEEVFELLIRDSVQKLPIRAIAKVVRSHDSCPYNKIEAHGMAVQFIIISDRDRRLVSAIVSNQATNLP